MGGWSSEREVSLSSGEACATGIEDAGYKVTRVDVGRDVSAVLSELKPDVAFNALHGPYGEDGTIQGILEYLEIPYTHSGVLASSLAMDKELSKRIAKTAGIPVANSLVMNRRDAAEKHVMTPPYVIKPVAEGSSFGLLIVREDMSNPPQELFSDEWPYGERIMVEKYVAGRELTCTIMGDVALGVTEIVTEEGGWYDFDAKYAKGGSKHECPAKIKRNIYQKIQTLSLKAHQVMGCRGVSRSDFRLDDGLMGTGELAWLEINTQPGMTPTSLVPELAAHAGHSFEELMRWMVEDASCCR
ncbi:MAG: D-alanine--D-alanine ligase [Rhizobiaceae bacterium]|nr:D-alanine--D-alanine ligase [Rhizobiaceae bacterium]